MQGRKAQAGGIGDGGSNGAVGSSARRRVCAQKGRATQHPIPAWTWWARERRERTARKEGRGSEEGHGSMQNRTGRRTVCSKARVSLCVHALPWALGPHRPHVPARCCFFDTIQFYETKIVLPTSERIFNRKFGPFFKRARAPSELADWLAAALLFFPIEPRTSSLPPLDPPRLPLCRLLRRTLCGGADPPLRAPSIAGSASEIHPELTDLR